MKLVLPAAVFLLMVSVGMSLRHKEMLASVRRMRWTNWIGLVLATFIVPAALALLLGRVLPLIRAEMAGLFLVGSAPGAPLMTRNIAKRGFDMQLAASYQVWGGLLTPIMLPIMVGLAGLLYNVRIWIPPRDVLAQIAEKQFVPLLVGILLARYLPAFSAKAQPWMNRLGNLILTVAIVALLWFMRDTLKGLLTWWLPLGALILALGSVAAIRLLVPTDDLLTRRTLAICNANRHVGLALLLSGQYLRIKGALPAVAAYALIAPFVMGGLSWWFHRREETKSQPLPA
ncbi:MAG TPA: bile acid:sodium symporter [Candidatus Eisenbacteria bacterium]|nr:bile acid:sodium symporter [Candidatus Eisenbacteria bacterium]